MNASFGTSYEHRNYFKGAVSMNKGRNLKRGKFEVSFNN